MLDRITKTTQLKEDHYVVASNKMYMVGNQDGTFSDIGFHVEGEMSGIFAQPIKLSKGYKIFINNKLKTAGSYGFDNGESIFTYTTSKGKLTNKVNALDDLKVLNFALETESAEPQEVVFSVDFKLVGCWTAKECNFEEGKTLVVDKTEHFIGLKQEKGNYFASMALNGEGTIKVEEAGDSQQVKVTGLVSKDKPLLIYITSNNESYEALLGEAKYVLEKGPALVKEQRKRRGALLSRTQITTNDKAFDEAFQGLKLNYDMLVQNIDNIGEGYTAGYPDFQWFFGCDTTYGSHGTLAVGQHEMTKQTLRLLKEISWKVNGNGRVIHEISPFGMIYGKGNLQETPHFITAVYETYKWTGDKAFLDEMFDFCVQGMEWVETKIQPGSLCPKGNGIVEIEGINGRVLDIAILTIDAYRQLAYMAEAMGRNELIAGYDAKREALEKEVVEKFYCQDEKFFGDVVCTIDEVKASRDILVNSVKNTKTLTPHMAAYFDKVLAKTYEKDELIPLVLKNWICVLPYTEDFVPKHIKEEGLKQMLQPAFYNDYGMKLGCMCDDKNDPVHDIYTVNKSMSINTGYLAEVFARNGQVDKGYELLKKLVDCMHVGMPMAISEILPNDGCFMQFWSGYGIHHVFIRDLLGIKVDAPNKKIVIEPNLPKALNFVEIKNLQVGACHYDITYKVVDGKLSVDVVKDLDDYTVEIKNN